MDRRCLAQLRKVGLELRHFFDVGACVGGWTRHVRLDFPEATFDMFEPLAEHSPVLRERLAAVQDGKLCRLHKVALGAETRRATMYMFPDNIPGSTSLELIATPPASEVVEVQMLALDDAISRLGLPIPDFIKMDTQGGELNILKGARKTLPEVQVLMIECWLQRAYGPNTPLLLEIAGWLREFDFYLWDLADQWRDDAGNLGSQDCFFLNARSKASPLQSELQKVVEAPPKSQSTRGWARLAGRWLNKARADK